MHERGRKVMSKWRTMWVEGWEKRRGNEEKCNPLASGATGKWWAEGQSCQKIA
jgi:hypothetical protein